MALFKLQRIVQSHKRKFLFHSIKSVKRRNKRRRARRYTERHTEEASRRQAPFLFTRQFIRLFFRNRHLPCYPNKAVRTVFDSFKIRFALKIVRNKRTAVNRMLLRGYDGYQWRYCLLNGFPYAIRPPPAMPFPIITYFFILTTPRPLSKFFSSYRSSILLARFGHPSTHAGYPEIFQTQLTLLNGALFRSVIRSRKDRQEYT